MTRRQIRTVAVAALTLLNAAAARADEVLVAVAANFSAPMTRITEDFQAATGHTVKLVTGSTGKFYTQIAAGAPFEVLLSADDETPKRLIQDGHAVAGSAFTYAIGQLVLWSAQPGLVDDQGAVLTSGRFTRLAIANPKLAPYGRAAMQVLRTRKLADALAPRLVTGESIAQAWQFVATGNAEIGFVALSQVQVPGKPIVGSMWRVPAALHDEIRQDAVLLHPGEKKAGALALLRWLRGEAARDVIRAWGYAL